jgi:phosphatidylserine/phosphatidylglycerophosphate/cardiolipin synthase-like enzyme
VSGIAHNKVMIIDDMHVLTGSFNWSQAAATSNAENLLLITDKEINQLYTANWIERAKHAEVIP